VLELEQAAPWIPDELKRAPRDQLVGIPWKDTGQLLKTKVQDWNEMVGLTDTRPFNFRVGRHFYPRAKRKKCRKGNAIMSANRVPGGQS